MESYFDCYKRNNLFYNWLAFFDVDEILIINKNNTIQKFLKNSRYNKCELIKINWAVFTDNDQLYYEDKPLKARFTKRIKINEKINTVVKVIIRGNLINYSSRKIIDDPHKIFKSNKTCDSNGIIKYGRYINPPQYKYATLNHYYTKTIEEFCRKIKKGDVFSNRTLGIRLIKYFYNKFFKYNKKTKSKILIFNKEFNLNFFH